MGCQKAEVEAKEATVFDSSSFSDGVSDALLFTTMCMIGLPVEVQVKDGSICSGIFHTACFQNDYGIILKKAKMEKKGKYNANIGGALVDTLVIFTKDLVQVVAKGLLLSADGISGNVASNDVETVMGLTQPQAGHRELEREPESLKSGKVASERSSDHNAETNSSHGLTNTNIRDGLLTNVRRKPSESVPEAEYGKMEGVCRAKSDEDSAVQVVSSSERQAGKEKPQFVEDLYGARKDSNIVRKVPSFSSSTSCLPHPKSVEGRVVEISADGAECVHPVSPLISSEASDGAMPFSTSVQSSDFPAPNASNSTLDVTSASSSNRLAAPTVVVPSNNSVSNTSAKEFKLNPGAKTFSPSFASPRSVPPPVSTVGYVPNSSAVLPVAGVHPGVEISPLVPHPSVPLKLVSYNNLFSGNNGSGSQYSLPIVGHIGGRQQPVRYGSPFQTGPAYVHPNPQTVMVGRMGPVVYVHPIPHDAIQGAAALSQVPARPMLTPHQSHLPKHQGTAAQTLQLCMTPPVVASVQQPFSVPSHIPFPQPFPTMRPTSGPGSKFQ
ncbi:polyadenylate-binding protein-interacting protein 3-like isoform X3 [Magnolia sinica]|uniref:polyadenylate-binding protein-interacting protein 3-like isoform X3 n=1 Tax=Magnolia sinica TaxID=86752 RepID=UPI00265A0D51|nr:polyadenylate-binding protein-interacting protein 3-like isoform X3 [Magnolia sinica]